MKSGCKRQTANLLSALLIPLKPAHRNGKVTAVQFSWQENVSGHFSKWWPITVCWSFYWEALMANWSCSLIVIKWVSLVRHQKTMNGDLTYWWCCLQREAAASCVKQMLVGSSAGDKWGREICLKKGVLLKSQTSFCSLCFVASVHQNSYNIL